MNELSIMGSALGEASGAVCETAVDRKGKPRPRPISWSEYLEMVESFRVMYSIPASRETFGKNGGPEASAAESVSTTRLAASNGFGASGAGVGSGGGDPDEFGRVLAVGDEPLDLLAAVQSLDLDGIAVTIASSDDEVMEMIERGDKPTVVLLDAMMSNMSGYEICEKLRKMYTASELAIIMLTSEHGLHEGIKVLETGADGYIAKPFSPKELTARIHAHFKQMEASAALDETLGFDNDREQNGKEGREPRRMGRWMIEVLNSIEDAVMAINEREEICFCNGSCERLLGYSDGELTGLPFSALVPGRIRAEVFRLTRKPRTRCLKKRYEKILFRRADSGVLSLDATLARLEFEDERLIVLILRRSADAPGMKARGRDNGRIRSIVQELKRNRKRIRGLKQKLDDMNIGSSRISLDFINELNGVDAILKQIIRVLPGWDKVEDYRLMIPEILNLAIDYWIEDTRTTKIDLAKRSKLWTVYMNLDGWERAQTLDKYMDPKTLPRNPRWKQVFKTVDFVLDACITPSPARGRLEAMLARLRLLC